MQAGEPSGHQHHEILLGPAGLTEQPTTWEHELPLGEPQNGLLLGWLSACLTFRKVVRRGDPRLLEPTFVLPLQNHIISPVLTIFPKHCTTPGSELKKGSCTQAPQATWSPAHMGPFEGQEEGTGHGP